MRQLYAPFHLILAFPLCTHLFTITGTPEVAITIQTRTSQHGILHVYKPALTRRGEHRSRIQLFFSSPFLLLSLTRVLPRPSNRLAELLSARSWPASRACQISVNAPCFPPLFSLTLPFLSLLLGRHFHPRSTYPRYTTSVVS